MGVPMPALFELLYKEFCRARLAEMRKQLLLTGKHPELFRPADTSSNPDGAGDADVGDGTDLKHAGK